MRHPGPLKINKSESLPGSLPMLELYPFTNQRSSKIYTYKMFEMKSHLPKLSIFSCRQCTIRPRHQRSMSWVGHNRMWRPCCLPDTNEMNLFCRWTSKNHSCKVWFKLTQSFQRFQSFWNWPIRNKNCLWLSCFCPMKGKWGIVIDDLFNISLVNISSVVSDENIDMWKVYRWRTPSDSNEHIMLGVSWAKTNLFLTRYDWIRIEQK